MCPFERERIERGKKDHRDRVGVLLEGLEREADQLTRLVNVEDYCGSVGRRLQTFGFTEKRLALEALGVVVRVDGRDWSLECTIPISDTAAGADDGESGSSASGKGLTFVLATMPHCA
jgi:hypothetical protein